MLLSVITVTTLVSLLALTGPQGTALAAEGDDMLAILETNLGTITIEFFSDDAPNHVDNFVGFVESGFYDGTLFHRIMPGFMIQGGDPNTIDGDPSTWGKGGPGTMIDAEFNQIKHNRGIVSMARTFDPNSAGSQFFIVHADSNFLDGQYTAFGRAVTEESLDTLDKIAAVQTTGDAGGNQPVDIEQVRITKAMMVQRDGVPDLLDLPEPERMDATPDAIPPPISPDMIQEFDAQEYGIAIEFPTGWSLQQPEKISEHTPDVIAIGPKTGIMHPAFIFVIKSTEQRTLDELIAERAALLAPSVESKGLEITTQEKTEINGIQGHVIEAKQTTEFADGNIVVMFMEVMLYNDETFYTITYSNGADAFDEQLPMFEQTVDSFRILGSNSDDADDNVAANQGDTGEEKQEEGGNCLIATAAYGSEMAPRVQQLREIRDNTVLSTTSGTAFMSGAHQIYYLFSPTIAELERENPLIKETVKLTISPMLSSLSLLNYADIDSEQEMLSYGMALILLNLGMYIAAPAVVIYKVGQKLNSKRQAPTPTQ